MAAVLPIVSFALALLVIKGIGEQQKRRLSWRHAILLTSVCWGVYVVAVTEALGAFGLLIFGWVLLSWLLPAGILAAVSARSRHPRISARILRLLAIKLEWPRAVLLGGVALILALTALIAFLAPPNTADSMTYHMPRIMRWIQQGSLAYYPTNTIRQLIQPPWAEYAMLHLQILSGGDQLANFVEWGSFAGCCIGASLIAEQLGADRRGQLVAAVFTATLPMAIIQASSTQNDLVVGYWLVCSAFFLLAYLARRDLPSLLAFGGGIGLSILTKGTGYLVAMPLLLIFCAYALSLHRWSAWRVVLPVVALMGALNAGFLARNTIAFGYPLGPTTATAYYANATFSPGTLTSNLVRNVAVEFGTPESHLNALVEHAANKTLEAFHLDPRDHGTTMARSPVFHVRGATDLWRSDGYTDNPLHMVLILAALALFLLTSALRKQRLLAWYLAALVGCFLLFCLYLRWQAQSNRLELPFFILFAPFCGLVLSQLPQARWRKAASLAPFILLALAPFWLLAGQSRPLLGAASVLATPRTRQYFAGAPQLEAPMEGAVRYITSKGCDQVGFYASGPQDNDSYAAGAPSWEYPFWVLLRRGGGRVRIEQAHVTNATASLAPRPGASDFHPCAVIVMLSPGEPVAPLTDHGATYEDAWSWGIVHVFEAAPSRAAPSGPAGASPAALGLPGHSRSPARAL